MVIVSDYSKSFIPAGITLRGSIEGSAHLTVAGTVEGDITLEDTLVVLEGGLLRGRITVRQAVISGRVEGTLIASDKAEISSTANVNGDIRARRLTIIEGALVNGTLVTGDVDAQLPQPE
jgi:cytoskeletal protein CcmA (bactofilin family)